MKRIFFMLPLLCLLIGAFCSCKGEVAVIDGSLGLGIHSANDATDAEGSEAGEGSIVHTACSVILDGGGKILAARFDEINVTVEYSSEGKALSVYGTQSARELKDKYTSGGESSWHVQADVFEQKIEGKTLEEAKGLVGNDGKGLEELQAAGCKMELAELVIALEKACTNAKTKVTGVVGASVGIFAEVSGSESATAESDGAITVKATFAATAAMPGGVISGAVSDESEATFTFDKTGKSTIDLTKTLTTKRNLGDSYGMAKHGTDYDGDGRVLEWYAQANAFDEALVGRRPSGVSKMVTSGGYGTETIIKSGCTIKITNMVKAVEKALKNA